MILNKHLTLFILVFFPCLASGIRPDSLFLSDKVIDIELIADFTAIQNERTVEPEYHEGELIYHIPGRKKVRLNVKVESRGYFRRDPDHCNFPPLTVNFRKSEVKNTLFDNQDKLKLVTPCHDDKDVIDEYLVYRLYGRLTERSLNVRLVRVFYNDTGLNKIILKGYSFFIEHEDEAAKRMVAEESEKIVTPFDLDRPGFMKLALFQYMIGNKDWYVSSRKNIIIMQPDDKSLKPFAVPYDFDFSGLVNADYTRPEGVPIEFLATRKVYKGLCYSEQEFSAMFTYFQEIRPVLEKTIIAMKYLPSEQRKENLAYIDDFYKAIAGRDEIIRQFLAVCETRKLYNLPELVIP